MGLIQNILTTVLLTTTFTLFFLYTGYSFEKEDISEYFDNGLNEYSVYIGPSLNEMKRNYVDSTLLYKGLALTYAKLDETELACEFIEKYIEASLDVSFLEDNSFNKIRESDSFILMSEKYKKRFNVLWMFCLYVGFIGVFVAVFLNFKRKSDRIANFLISAFLMQHSIFIICISLLPTNYKLDTTSSLFLSSFLYGPILYLYFKRVIFQYRFTAVDLLHLTPLFLQVLLLFSFYNLFVDDGFWNLLNEEQFYITFLSDANLVSLLIYLFLLIKIYYGLTNRELNVPKKQFYWYRNIIVLYSIYTICYAVYDILMMRHIIQGFPAHFLMISIAILILYISYVAFVYPSVIGGFRASKGTAIKHFEKYRKSGLTEAFSLELKGKLLYLLNQEKIYRKNDINLLDLADLMGTTRHNASQIINEHFNLNFFELINKYRIEEANELLKNKNRKKISIIQVAYEVGFNNKVTFNKSFKKYNRVTPSEYVKS